MESKENLEVGNKQQTKRSKVWMLFPLTLLLIVGGVFMLRNVDIDSNTGDDKSTSVNSDQDTPSSGEPLPEDLDYDEVEDIYDELRANFDGDLDPDGLIDGMIVALGTLAETEQSPSSDLYDDIPRNLDYDAVEVTYDVLKPKLEEFSLADIDNSIKKGLVDGAGDQYTVYLDESQANEFTSGLNGTFTGIGAQLGKQEDRIVIVAPIAGFPAEKAGLRPQDKILAIDGESALELEVEEAVTRIRGEKGTNVVLTIGREGEDNQDITIKRDEIVIPSVTWRVEEDKIGYISIARFAEDTAGLTEQASDELLDQNVESIILDLRSNGGGFLDSSVDVASLWVDDKLIVEQKRSGEVVREHRASRGADLAGIKTIVLVDGGTASASEILAGALQDYDLAEIAGTQTFGKGSVQTLNGLDDDGVLKVTTARWFTPNGQNIDKEGIKPDQEFDQAELLESEDDKLLLEIIEQLK